VCRRVGKLLSAGYDIRTMLAYHIPSYLGVGKHEREEVHGSVAGGLRQEELDPRAQNAIRGTLLLDLGFGAGRPEPFLSENVSAPL
jgi:hypothetical protein